MEFTLNFFNKIPHPAKKTILLILAVAFLTILTTTLLSTFLSRVYNTRIPSLGTIHTIGVKVYGGNITEGSDGSKHLDWGTIYPGSSTIRSFHLKSESNIPITLKLSTRNWTLLNSKGENVTKFLTTPKYMQLNESFTLTWNYNGTPLTPTQEIYVSLRLNATSDVKFINYLIDYQVREFSFDIIITGNGT